jgi:homoserine kinase type II
MQSSRVAFIHAVLLHAASRDFDILPAPIRSTSGATYVMHRRSLWELTPWLPGRANFHATPSREKLSSAMTSLARFHECVSTFERQRISSSPGIRQRRKMVDDLKSSELSSLATAVSKADATNRLAAKSHELLNLVAVVLPRLQTELARAIGHQSPLQPCIRDIWHDHILFTGNEVTGIVDFGATQMDSVATDIARLLGSLVRDDEDLWQFGIDEYCRVRALNAAERQLVRVFDRSFVTLAGINWIRWIFVERRQFEDESRIHARIDEILNRLRFLAANTPPSF